MLRRNANALAAASALLAALPAVAQVEPPDITRQQPSSAPARPEPVSASTAREGDVANPPAAVTTIPQQPTIQVGGGYLHQFSESAGDNGGSMSADRFYASFSSRMVMSDELTLTLAMGYEFDWYHWSGASPFTVQDPWGSVNLFGLQLRGSFKVAKDWTATVGGIFAMAGETNADAGDSIYGGGIASVAWTPTRDLMLGLGVLGVTQLEDDPLIIPIPVVHWHFAEEWSSRPSAARPPAPSWGSTWRGSPSTASSTWPSASDGSSGASGSAPRRARRRARASDRTRAGRRSRPSATTSRRTCASTSSAA